MVTRKTEGFRLWLVDSSFDEDEQRFDELTAEAEIAGDPRWQGWRIVPDVEITPRGLRLRRLVIEPSGPDTPPSGITTRMLRDLKTGPLISTLRVAAAQSKALFGTPDLSIGHRVGRGGRDERFYAEWAREYVAACARSVHPVADLAARYHVSASQVRNLTYACRKRGMLTRSLPGRAGGELTEKALRLLEEADGHGERQAAP